MVQFVKRNSSTLKYVILALTCMFGWLLSTHNVAAQTPSVFLTVNSGGSASIINGTPVTLEWFAQNVSNCVINNGVGSIPNSDLPSGSRTVIPPDNLETTYTMTCEGAADSVTVTLIPEVTLTLDPADLSSYVLNPTGRSARIRGVTWTSRFATECNPQIQIIPLGWDQVGLPSSWPTNRRLSGSDDNDRFIRGDSIIRLTCTNAVTGLSGTASLLIQPADSDPTPPPEVTITAQPKLRTSGTSYTNSSVVEYDPEYGIGWVDIRTVALYATWCERWITFESRPSPSFAEQAAITTIHGSRYIWHNDKMTMQQIYGIPETTTFHIECRTHRNAALSTPDRAYASVTVPFTRPVGVNPIPTVSVTGPVAVAPNPITGDADISVGLSSQFVNSCIFSPRNWESNAVPGWSDLTPSTIRGTFPVTIRDDTTFAVDCTGFDLQAAADVLTVVVSEPVPAPPPTVSLSAGATQVPGTGTDPGEVELSWTAANASWCQLFADTGTVTYEVLEVPMATAYTGMVTVFDSTTFTITCGRGVDDLTASDSVAVALVPPSTIIDASVVTAAGECIDPDTGIARPSEPGEYAGIGGVCTENPTDLTIRNVGINAESEWTVNDLFGTYNNIELRKIIENLGPGELRDEVSYRFDIAFNGSIATFISDRDWIQLYDPLNTGPRIPLPSGATSPVLRVTVNDVPFGTHVVRARVNLDPTTIFEGDGDEMNDNIVFHTFTLPVPQPPMSITADRRVVRRGQATNVNWEVSSGFDLDCVVRGAGIAVTDIELRPASGSAVTVDDTQGTTNILSTTDVSLTCTEPTTGTAFTETVRIEVVPDIAEI